MRKILTLMLVMGIFFTAAPAAMAKYTDEGTATIKVYNSTNKKLIDLCALDRDGEWVTRRADFIAGVSFNLSCQTETAMLYLRAAFPDGETVAWEIDSSKYNTVFLLPGGNIKTLEEMESK
jgi:hypothetical protein